MKQGSVILITGASSGIGKAAAKRLADRGYRVFGTSRQSDSTSDPGVTMLQLDVTHDDCVKNCIGEVIEKAGRLDVLVNNAGYAHSGPLEDVSLDDLKAQFDTNLYGVHRMTQASLPHMFAQGNGRIINISSGIDRVSIPFYAAYCSSKFALEGYSEGLAKELKGHGIDVVIVEPGLTDSEFHDNRRWSENISEKYQQVIGQMQAGSPDRMKHADSVETVAEVIQQAMEDAEPNLRYVCPAAQGIINMAGAKRL